jgi:hypothetical protein
MDRRPLIMFSKAYELPVTLLVEILFYKSVKYFAERRTKAETAVQQRFLFSSKIQALLEERTRTSEYIRFKRVKDLWATRLKEIEYIWFRWKYPEIYLLVKNYN